MYICFDFGWYSVHLDIACLRTGGGAGGLGGLLNGQYPLSMTKFICPQSSFSSIFSIFDSKQGP